MPSYLVTYDLTQGNSSDYEELYKAIKSYGTWARVTTLSWIVVTDNDQSKVRDHLGEFLKSGDQITNYGDTALNYGDTAFYFVVGAPSSSFGLGPRLRACRRRRVVVSSSARNASEPTGRPTVSTGDAITPRPPVADALRSAGPAPEGPQAKARRSAWLNPKAVSRSRGRG